LAAYYLVFPLILYGHQVIKIAAVVLLGGKFAGFDLATKFPHAQLIPSNGFSELISRYLSNVIQAIIGILFIRRGFRNLERDSENNFVSLLIMSFGIAIITWPLLFSIPGDYSLIGDAVTGMITLTNLKAILQGDLYVLSRLMVIPVFLTAVFYSTYFINKIFIDTKPVTERYDRHSLLAFTRAFALRPVKFMRTYIQLISEITEKVNQYFILTTLFIATISAFAGLWLLFHSEIPTAAIYTLVAFNLMLWLYTPVIAARYFASSSSKHKPVLLLIGVVLIIAAVLVVLAVAASGTALGAVLGASVWFELFLHRPPSDLLTILPLTAGLLLSSRGSSKSSSLPDSLTTEVTNICDWWLDLIAKDHKNVCQIYTYKAIAYAVKINNIRTVPEIIRRVNQLLERRGSPTIPNNAEDAIYNWWRWIILESNTPGAS